MAYAGILVQTREEVATVTLNRPQQMNPLDWDTVRELGAALKALADDPAVRVVVITGRGPAFSAGGDLKSYRDLYRNPDGFRKFLRDLHDVLDGIERSPKVVIAAVNGHCLAGGLELMLACDLVVASEDARIGDAHLNFGQVPGGGGSQRLPRAIGVLRAKQLFFTGDRITGREAERIGLVNRAVPAGELLAAVNDLAARIVTKSPLGLQCIKSLVTEGMQVSLRAALELELDRVHHYATSTEDAMEGLIAFAEKRTPTFKGV